MHRGVCQSQPHKQERVEQEAQEGDPSPSWHTLSESTLSSKGVKTLKGRRTTRHTSGALRMGLGHTGGTSLRVGGGGGGGRRTVAPPHNMRGTHPKGGPPEVWVWSPVCSCSLPLCTPRGTQRASGRTARAMRSVRRGDRWGGGGWGVRCAVQWAVCDCTAPVAGSTPAFCSPQRPVRSVPPRGREGGSHEVMIPPLGKIFLCCTFGT